MARIMQNHTAIKRWEETNVLFIDEVSQLSRRTFENLDFVAKTVRNNTFPFGGIQVVAVGDFHQLPPVANVFDDGSYAFESSLWNTVFPHSLLLSKVYRQEEQDLLDLLNEFAVGKCSNSSARFIQECARPLNAADFNLEFVPKLFSTNDGVNWHNRMELEQVPGEQRTFTSGDSGKISILNKITVAEPVLALKVGAPAMLIYNISEKL